MRLRIRPSAFSVRGILKMALSASLLLGGLCASASGQTPPANEPGDIHGGIEISADGVKAVAIRISQGEEGPGAKLVYSEFVRLPLGRASSGGFKPQAALDAAQTVLKLLTQLGQQHRIPSERIYLIGSSELGADPPEDLAGAVSKMTGKTLTFLDPETEIQLRIVGTVPRRERFGSTWTDRRNSSMLIDIGSNNTKAGYQLLKHSLPSPPRYDFVSTNIPQGTVNYSNEIRRALGETSDWLTFAKSANALSGGRFREALRKEWESKPGLLNRKRVYLTGGIAWALATLLYPEKRQTYIPIRAEDIALFVSKVAQDPKFNPDLSQISDRELRQEVGQELIAVRSSFTPDQLMAGAELLRTISSELKWQEKQILFARFGHLGCILSYIRLQIEKQIEK